MKSSLEALNAQLMLANKNLTLALSRAEATTKQTLNSLDELTRASKRDFLTDTPNRMLFLDRLHRAIAMSRRRNTRAAVLFVDLDHFKHINDTLGHAAGDEVLKLVARKLCSVVRDSDSVSRHGGDEFLVLLSEVTHAADAALICRKILRSLAQPSTVNGRKLPLSASIGISIFPDDATDAATLINKADAAMYRSKRGCSGGFSYYTEDLLGHA